MANRTIITAAFAAATCVFAGPVFADATCAERDKIITILALNHGEALTGRGMKDGDALFEIWHSADSGTWTILRTDAAGTSCVMAAGTHWMPGVPSDTPKGHNG